MDSKIYYDSLGPVYVDDDKLWGPATQRSLENFTIGAETMPFEIIKAITAIKIAAAQVHAEMELLPCEICKAVIIAGEEVLQGSLDDQFPLKVWQTGSGTQTNMNVNEVLANRASYICGQKVHPNDHVNKSQSSNDVFPSAIHIAAASAIHQNLLPALQALIDALRKKEEETQGIIKVGRTHLQDATPIRFSQEISGWRALCEQGREMLLSTLPFLYRIPIGATAVGTGINAPKGFDEKIVEKISRITDLPFQLQNNKFAGLSGKDGIVFVHGALKTLAANLWKIANDIRFLASGPRCGLGEITIPSNEPGSSIMPGKVNPTQCEAVTMVAAQVMGNDVAIGFVASQGNFQLNVFMPLIAYDVLMSIRLLAGAITSFTEKCVKGLAPNEKKMQENLSKCLMLVTALNPVIGYDNGAKIVKKAAEDNISLRSAAEELGFLSGEEFDRLIDPEKMV